MRCLPCTEPAGIAGRAAEQCTSTSKAENHRVKFEDKNACPEKDVFALDLGLQPYEKLMFGNK